jgi:hypothetical protein
MMERLRRPPAHYFQMAMENRLIATRMDDDRARLEMLAIAAEYERMSNEATALDLASAP